MTENQRYGIIDRTGWAPGPWDGEPDEATWRSSTGLACRALRSEVVGAWNGYVEIPRDHPWFGLDYDALPNLDVHGGLTFAGAIGEGWWIGFDCGHYDDVMPALDALLERFGHDPPMFALATYKDLRYVKGGCAWLALQVRIMAD